MKEPVKYTLNESLPLPWNTLISQNVVQMEVKRAFSGLEDMLMKGSLSLKRAFDIYQKQLNNPIMIKLRGYSFNDLIDAMISAAK